MAVAMITDRDLHEARDLAAKLCRALDAYMADRDVTAELAAIAAYADAVRDLLGRMGVEEQ